MHFERFTYTDAQQIKQKADTLGVWLPLRSDISALLAPVQIGGRTIPNRIAVQPMEGADGQPDGSPGELSARRYRRFAGGGPGIIWFEAVAITPDGRGNPRQLWLTRHNVAAFARLVEDTKAACLREHGFAPLIIMQASHSGRYSRPQGVPAPLIAYNNPLYEGDTPIDAACIADDDRLDALTQHTALSAALAQQAGFDGVDIKCCHRYLASELLSAYERKGRYGGSLANRSRLLREGMQAARAATSGDFIVTTRLNVYDGFAYPYGFGVAPGGGTQIDMSEPLELIGQLCTQNGLALLNVTMGNPYVNPHVNRPYDQGSYVPGEHPLVGVSRLMQCAAAVQRQYPALAVLASGLSYLRQYAPLLAAGIIAQGGAALAGFGREALAYPDFPQALRRGETLDSRKVCITCGQCAARLRAGLHTGCVIRDGAIYQAVR